MSSPETSPTLPSARSFFLAVREALAGSEQTTLVTDGRGGGSGTYSGNSNWTDADVWQTWSGRKGDECW